MKKSFVVVFVAGLALAAAAQEARLFPKNSFGGYAQFDLAPPHNEWDLNRCAPNAGSAPNGGASAPCTAFARGAVSGHLEFKPINMGPFRRLYFFVKPQFFLGDNLPQARYSSSFAAIGLDRTAGFIYELPWSLELRVTQHAKMHWFGKYQRPLGPADMAGDGPFGQYNTIGIRKSFGTFRQRRVE